MKTPAKLNLFLEVTGKRPNGYHELYSLSVFLDLCDEIKIELANEISCTPDIENNIILKAAELLKEKYSVTHGCKIELTKNIPIGGGLGGGSSNAAATLFILNKLWNLNLPESEIYDLGLRLGADVPVCLFHFINGTNSTFFSGIGEMLEHANKLPDMHLVVVNPNKPLETRKVFEKFAGTNFCKMRSFDWHNDDDFFNKLKTRRNDLEDPAIWLLPEIAQILAEIQSSDNCIISRMTGSGSTCFGVFRSKEDTELASKKISAAHPEWLVKSVSLV